MERGHAPDVRRLSVQLNVCAEPAQLRHMGKARGKHRLADFRPSLRAQQRRHDGRLRVRREAGVRRGHDRSGRVQRARADAKAARLLGNVRARLPQRPDDGPQLFRARAGEIRLAARGRRGAQIGRRHDAVRPDRVLRAVERRHAQDADDRRSVACDLRAERAQEIRKLHDLRLARRAGDHALTAREHGGHQRIFRRADARVGKPHCAAAQLPTADNVPAAHVGLRAERGKCRKVQVDRPRPQLAPAGQAERRAPCPAEQRPGEQNGRAHGLHQFVRNVRIRDAARRDAQRVRLTRHRRAGMAQYRSGRVHVRQMRDIAQHAGVLCQCARRQNGQRAVFCALNGRLSVKRLPAANDELRHTPPSEG